MKIPVSSKNDTRHGKIPEIPSISSQKVLENVIRKSFSLSLVTF